MSQSRGKSLASTTVTLSTPLRRAGTVWLAAGLTSVVAIVNAIIWDPEKVCGVKSQRSQFIAEIVARTYISRSPPQQSWSSKSVAVSNPFIRCCAEDPFSDPLGKFMFFRNTGTTTSPDSGGSP